MAKTLLGIDVGTDSLKLALVTGRRVKKTAIVPMPVNLVKEGRVVSVETMGELLRNTLKKTGMRNRAAALAFANETVFVRNVTLPVMTSEQLTTNLPYEFRDYISDELKNYVFDYAMITGDKAAGKIDTPADDMTEGEADKAESMDLIAAAAPIELVNETKDFIRKGGMALTVAAPSICSYINLIRGLRDVDPNKEYCILDLGYRAIRMYIFRGDAHIVTRVLEMGLSSLDDVLAEQFNVDVHLAHTYLLTNCEDCQNGERCASAYNSISVELLRAINFFRFSNQETSLNDVYLGGGGAAIVPLCREIESSLGMTVHHVSEFVEGGESIENCDSLVQAIGIASC